MKNYKKVQMITKNSPKGSYAAGCPAKDRAGGSLLLGVILCDPRPENCANCERTA